DGQGVLTFFRCMDVKVDVWM
nr:hypothetical protein [Tanacetum cinerariifolium]